MESFDKSDQLKDRLGAEKFLAVADARREMWTGGLGGLLLGSGIAYTVQRLRPSAAPLKPLQQRQHNSRVAAVTMLVGAGCSYLGAMFLGTPSLHRFTRSWD